MPGRIDTKRGIAHTGGILSGFMWEQPFAALLEQRLGVPVTIANDGKCAAAAEAWTGSLAGVDNGLVLVLGTGIGGGIILNGKVYMGSHSAAGEVSNLVTELGSMEGDDFRFEVIGKVAESPVWAGKASASGLIAAYAAEKQLPAHAPQPTGEEIFAAYALLPAIQTELDDLFARCPVFPMLEPELVRCRYGNDANMIGALKLFFERTPA